MHQYGFEKLSVWQSSRQLTLKVYDATKQFPSDEKFGLVTQIRRAMISVSSNIAEGSSRNTSKDQSHFYNLAYSSLIEVLNQTILSFDLGYVDATQYENIRTDIEEISNKLNALRKSIKEKQTQY